MALRDYTELIGPLIIPIRGKQYAVPPLPAAVGARFTLAAEGQPDPELEAMTGAHVYRLILGDALDQMLADNVDWAAIERAYFAAIADWQTGREAAERVWEAGISPEYRAALIAAAQEAATKPSRATRRSPSTAKAGKTPTRAGSSTTKSRPATPRTAPAKTAKPSSGRRSSTSTGS